MMIDVAGDEDTLLMQRWTVDGAVKGRPRRSFSGPPLCPPLTPSLKYEAPSAPPCLRAGACRAQPAVHP